MNSFALITVFAVPCMLSEAWELKDDLSDSDHSAFTVLCVKYGKRQQCELLENKSYNGLRH